VTATLAPGPAMPRHRVLIADEHIPCANLTCRVEGDGRTTICAEMACPSCGSGDVATTGDGGAEPVWFCCTCGGEWAG
jgi:hypothetical protein